MKCKKCSGLMRVRTCAGGRVRLMVCMLCGNCIDPVIIRNRLFTKPKPYKDWKESVWDSIRREMKSSGSVGLRAS